MSEPEYIAQTAEPDNIADLRSWFDNRSEEAKAEGITFARYSVDDNEKPTLALIEGWKTPPKDQGPIRWQMMAAPINSGKDGR